MWITLLHHRLRTPPVVVEERFDPFRETEIDPKTIWTKWLHPSQAWKPPPGEPEQHKLCVVVPFRDSIGEDNNGGGRERQLEMFYPYMKRYLTQRDVSHLFIIAEQEQGSLLFNRGAILNFGLFLVFNFIN